MMLLFPGQAVHCHLFMRFFFSSFFCPPFPFLIQQSIWKWCLAVGVYTHVQACISLRAAFVCRASRLNGRLVLSLPPGCAGCSGAVQRQLSPLLRPILRLQGCSHNNCSRLKRRESVSSLLAEMMGPEMLQS